MDALSATTPDAAMRWKHNLAPESRAFALGAADVLYERIETLIEEQKKEHAGEYNGSYGLVLASKYDQELEANKKLLPSTLVVAKKRPTTVNASAYDQGSNYGTTIGLDKQVGNNANKQRRLG